MSLLRFHVSVRVEAFIATLASDRHVSVRVEAFIATLASDRDQTEY
jgi:hypothetical protein